MGPVSTPVRRLRAAPRPAVERPARHVGVPGAGGREHQAAAVGVAEGRGLGAAQQRCRQQQQQRRQQPRGAAGLAGSTRCCRGAANRHLSKCSDNFRLVCTRRIRIHHAEMMGPSRLQLGGSGQETCPRSWQALQGARCCGRALAPHGTNCACRGKRSQASLQRQVQGSSGTGGRLLAALQRAQEISLVNSRRHCAAGCRGEPGERARVDVAAGGGRRSRQPLRRGAALERRKHMLSVVKDNHCRQRVNPGRSRRLLERGAALRCAVRLSRRPCCSGGGARRTLARCSQPACRG